MLPCDVCLRHRSSLSDLIEAASRRTFGAISGTLGAEHGMAERDAAGCPSKSSPAPVHGCELVAKFVYCVRQFAKLGFEVFILCAAVCLHS